MRLLSAIDLAWTPEDDAVVVVDNEAWLDAFHAAMRPFTSDESFQNFVDGAETDKSSGETQEQAGFDLSTRPGRRKGYRAGRIYFK